MSESIYEHPYCLVGKTLCCGVTGEPILSLCCGAKILAPYPFSMTGICIECTLARRGPISLIPTLEAHLEEHSV